MNTANLSANLAIWMMLAASVLGIGFLVWFLVGVVLEGKRKTIRYVICYDYAEQTTMQGGDNHALVAPTGPPAMRHWIPLDLSHVAARALRKSA